MGLVKQNTVAIGIGILFFSIFFFGGCGKKKEKVEAPSLPPELMAEIERSREEAKNEVRLKEFTDPKTRMAWRLVDLVLSQDQLQTKF